MRSTATGDGHFDAIILGCGSAGTTAAKRKRSPFRALSQNVPLKRYADPEEVARAILYLASDEAASLTGSELVIDGG